MSQPNFVEDQIPTRTGRREFISVRGAKRLVRTYNPATRAWKYTRLGKSFFGRRPHIEYVVHVPCKIKGVRRDKKGNYERKTSVPVEFLGIGRMMVPQNVEQAEEWIKAKVLANGHRDDDGELVLYGFSEETYVYDEDGVWYISSLETAPGLAGQPPKTQVRLYDRLGAVSHSDLLHPELFIPEAFHERPGKTCVPYQLAAVLGIPEERIQEWFDDKLGLEWRELGIPIIAVVQYCEEMRLPCNVIRHNSVIYKHTPENPNRNYHAVSFAVRDGHAYFYKSSREFGHRDVMPVAPRCFVLATEPKEYSSTIATWRPWAGAFEPGEYYAEDMHEVRCQFLRSGRSPAVTLAHYTKIARLRYRLNAFDGWENPPEDEAENEEDENEAENEVENGPCIVVHAWSQHANEIRAWIRALRSRGFNLEWKGEGVAGISFKVFQWLVRRRVRDRLSEKEKEALAAGQDHRCALCAGIVEKDDREFDHVVPLRDRIESVFQMLCRSCHSSKTMLESNSGPLAPLVSVFSKTLWNHFVEAPPLPPLVFNVNAENKKLGILAELDVRRCRRNALRFNAHRIPLFCVLDEIRPRTECKLSDFQWIDADLPLKTANQILRAVPYSGKRWYCRAATEFLLNHGIVTWDHIKWTMDATASLPCDFLNESLDLMEEAWLDVERQGLQHLGKQAVNALLGLMGAPLQSRYWLRSGDSLEDGEGALMRHLTSFAPGQSVQDWVFETRLLTNQSHRPIHDMVVQTEHVRVAQILYMLKRCSVPERSIISIKTDAVVFHCAAKTHARVRDVVGGLRFQDLATLRTAYEPVVLRQLSDPRRVFPIAPIPSLEPVFKVGLGKPIQFQCKLPEISEQDAPVFPPDFVDVGVDEARRLVLEGQSILVLGIAGVGKTFWMKSVVSELRAAGKEVVVVAKTHCAVQNAEGNHTCNHFVHKYIRNGSTRADVIVIEEISQIDISIWCDLAKLALVNKQFLCLGDFNQFAPIGNNWRSGTVPDDALEKSSLLRELCPYRLTLTENKRSDPPLFDWFASLIPGGFRFGTDLADILKEASAAFPRKPGRPDYTLCISHRRRMSVNRADNLAKKPVDAVLIKSVESKPGDLNVPQDMWCFPGQQLIGCCRGRAEVANGCFYTVESVDASHLTLEGDIKLSHSMASRCLRLTHALTMASCQGLTLPGRVRIVETANPHFTLKHLFVALSRATAFNLVEIA